MQGLLGRFGVHDERAVVFEQQDQLCARPPDQRPHAPLDAGIRIGAFRCQAVMGGHGAILVADFLKIDPLFGKEIE